MVRVSSGVLRAELRLPLKPVGLVLVAHGNGLTAARARAVAAVLNQYRLASVLVDLLDEAEAVDRRNVFNIRLLAGRIEDTLDWADSHAELGSLRVGLSGAGTGAAAALWAASDRSGSVMAVVCINGRPDLANLRLDHVRSPTLLIVGGDDTQGLAVNRAALRRLPCGKRLEVVPGANHVFDPPDALDAAAQLAGAWFDNHLASVRMS